MSMMTEDELSKVADLVYQKLETKFHALDGVVGARGRRGEDGRQGPQGIPGRDANDGAEGKPGSSTRLVIIYKVTDDNKTPAAPNGGQWDFMTNKFTAPDGWSVDAPNNDNGYIWQSQAVFSSTGGQIQAWTQPFRLNAKDGGAGADSYTIEYVYKLTKDTQTIPDVPDNDYDTDDYTGDWEDNPQGIREDMKAEWVCSRLRQENGKWGDWIGPTLWSVWGSAGKDGDGVQYVFKRTTDKTPPAAITGNYDNENPNEWVPEDQGWTDDPTGVDEDNPFEWVSQRKFDGVNKVWKEWSEPKLWASWGKKGDTGLSAKFMFQDCIKGVNAPVVENKKDNPGEQWKDLVPFPVKEGHVIWACQALIDGDGHVYCDTSLPEKQQGWQGPWIITGADGEKGETGNEPDYTVVVFKQSDLKPVKPNGNEPANPGNGWQNTIPAETSDKNWWGCWGNVKHVDNPEHKKGDKTEPQLKQVSWGDPLPLNGNMGNPCVIAAFQQTFNGSKSITVSNGLAQGVQSVSIAIDNALLTATVNASAGYSVKVLSANCNIGTTKWLTVKETNTGRQRSAGAMYAAHVLIENGSSNKIYCQGWSQENKNNDSSTGRFWGTDQTSCVMTIFGTVTRTSVAG